tara:strand:+ start:647 stop:1873 length:1227 start_codon:yes stop_codon:yes gene_type:complete
MNPSSTGWITKHLHTLQKKPTLLNKSEEEIYTQLRKSGFLYGVSVSSLTIENKVSLKWIEAERTKVNLFDILYYTYSINTANPDGFLKTTIGFYEKLNIEDKNFLGIASRRKSNEETLERIFQERIQTNESLIQKNFSHLITNALLFLDVLAFDYYIKKGEDPLNYASTLEALIMNTVWLALTKKEDKSHYDQLLLKLFEKSLRYNKDLIQDVKDISELVFKNYSTNLEKRYILDLACLTVWNDEKVDEQEFTFIKDLGKQLGLQEAVVLDSENYVNVFIKSHRNDISYLNYSNPVKHFYNQTSRTVRILILRNKKRLITELSESKELLVLLSQSTYRELNKNEKKKVKSQLLDICKSIPSLAIFLLPGGGILLPLLIKFIPELLPSAFNENKFEEIDNRQIPPSSNN